MATIANNNQSFNLFSGDNLRGDPVIPVVNEADSLQGAIPADEFVYLPDKDDTSLMELRWQSKQFISNLLRQLSFYVFKEIKGKEYIVPMNKAVVGKPLINIRGALDVINIISSYANPMVSLSIMKDADSRQLWENTMLAVQGSLVENHDVYDCVSKSDKDMVMAMVKNITFHQAMRPVGGHESRNSRTNIVEQTQSSVAEQKITGGGFSLFKSNKNKGGDMYG